MSEPVPDSAADRWKAIQAFTMVLAGAVAWGLLVEFIPLHRLTAYLIGFLMGGQAGLLIVFTTTRRAR